MNRVVWESRHKFVYYDDESIESFRNLKDEYFAKMDSEEPIVIYELDDGLPRLDTNLSLDEYRIRIIYEHYYELVIFLAIIDSIYEHIKHDELNTRLERLFKLCSHISKREVNDINSLKTILVDSKKAYIEGYTEYMKTGKIDFYNEIPMPFVMMDDMLLTLKEKIGLNKYFCLMLEMSRDIDKYTCMAINDYIASRCNGYLSMNVLLASDKDWKTYYSNNGQFIQDIHDYTEKDFRKCKTKVYKK